MSIEFKMSCERGGIKEMMVSENTVDLMFLQG